MMQYKDNSSLLRALEKIEKCHGRGDCVLDFEEVDDGVRISMDDKNNGEKLTFTYTDRGTSSSRENGDVYESWSNAPFLEELVNTGNLSRFFRQTLNGYDRDKKLDYYAINKKTNRVENLRTPDI
jgi:hypothetical protein